MSSSRTANSSPPEACAGVGRAQTGAQALANRFQQPVAGLVAVTVVDGLEIVEVEEEGGDRAAAALNECEGVLDAVGEESAVGKTGQRVVKRLVAELPLELLALADVATDSLHAQHLTVLDDQPRGQLEWEPAPVLRHQLELVDGRPRFPCSLRRNCDARRADIRRR